jgi:hypothetical protein
MRYCLCFLLAATTLLAAEIRGKLTVRNGSATLETADHKQISLLGDETAQKVLSDQRLNGFEVQARGRFTAPERFEIEPSHTHPLLVHKDGKLKLVSYWCGVCSVRSYTPGPCVCCQEETTLELIDPKQK